MIISATPIVDNIKEIEIIYNIGDEDKILFSDKVISDVKANFIGQNYKNMTLFLSKLKGEELYNYLQIKNDVLYSNSRIAMISSNKSNPNSTI